MATSAIRTVFPGHPDSSTRRDLRYPLADIRLAQGRLGEAMRTYELALQHAPEQGGSVLRGTADGGQYRPFAAQRLAAGRRARPGRGKLVRDPVLRQFVQERLEKRWSPEQISHALRCEFPDEPERQVVHETIYQAIYWPELGGCAGICPRCFEPGGGAAGHTVARTPVARAGSLT